MLLPGGVIKFLCKLLKQYVELNEPDRQIVHLPDMIKWVSVLFMSSISEISFAKSLQDLGGRDRNIPNLENLFFINSQVIEFRPEKRGDKSSDEWSAKQDATKRVKDFSMWRTKWVESLTPKFTTVNLNDDIYGTRARDNQVKALRNRKAGKEGHCTDWLCESCFRITLGARFRRRGGTQFRNAGKLLNELLEGHWIIFLRGVIVSVDRGYGSLKLLRLLISLGMCGIMIMLSNLLRWHPFVADSCWVL